MITVLSEYKVLESKREEFLALLPQIRNALKEWGAMDIRFYEGTDQPGLFVEEFVVSDMSAYEEVKRLRKEEKAPIWSSFHSCIMGGKEKVHTWAFSELTDL